jgi:C4-dicarboxylate-specific signal transduction histidine kinase
MEQAMINLLKNAADAARGEAEVHVQRLHDGWRIDVMDSGPGMSATVMENALVPFLLDQAPWHRTGAGTGS